MNAPIQRPGIDADPVVPWVWATLVGRADPVEVLSYPIPAQGRSDIDRDSTIMVRMTVGEPGTLREVPLHSIACFDASRHEWYYRPKHVYDDGINAFFFTDEK